jgi:hypothetical protein
MAAAKPEQWFGVLTMDDDTTGELSEFPDRESGEAYYDEILDQVGPEGVPGVKFVRILKECVLAPIETEFSEEE